MSLNKIVISVVILLFAQLSFAAPAAPAAAADTTTTTTTTTTAADATSSSSPVEMLNATADQTIAQIKSEKARLKLSTNDVLPYLSTVKIIDNTLIPHVDLAGISQSTLGPAWGKATSAQQQHFMSSFKTLLINTYGSAIANYKNETMKFFPVRGGYQGKTKVQVHSELSQEGGDPLNIDYRVILKGGVWKVVDMSVEGVSLLESFRSQFASELKQGGMDQLLATLDKHNKAMTQQSIINQQKK